MDINDVILLFKAHHYLTNTMQTVANLLKENVQTCHHQIKGHYSSDFNTIHSTSHTHKMNVHLRPLLSSYKALRMRLIYGMLSYSCRLV